MKFTWKEIVDKTGLNLGVTTANFYRDKYIDYFDYTGSGRNRKYGERSVDVLRTIATLYKEGKSSDAILEALESNFVPTAEIVVNDNSTNTERQLEIIREVAENFMKENREIREQVLNLRDEIREMQEKNELHGRNHDERLMELIRLQQEQRQQNSRPFWKRILNKN